MNETTTQPAAHRIDAAYAAKARRVAWAGRSRGSTAAMIGVGDACRVERATDAAAGSVPEAAHAAVDQADD